jgi:hypothetical protein
MFEADMRKKANRMTKPPILRPWESISGHMYDCECELLAELARGKRALEIGTHHGRSAAAIASSALSVVTIDTYEGDAQIGPPSLEVTTKNLSPFANVRIVVGDWREIAIVPDDYDFIFYDGCHAEEGEFLALLHGFRGTIALHDYKPGEPGMSHVVEAVDEFALATGREKIIGAGSIVWFESIKE